jgi:hypothetical protein
MKHLLSLLPLLATVVTSAGVHAQCLTPDHADGPCCSTVTNFTLPSFPPQTLPGQSICWDSCNVSSQLCAQVKLTAPLLSKCGQYTVDLSTTDCGAGLPQLKGKLNLDYTRTWDEFPTTGQTIQVWRFLVKADLSLAGTSTGACPFPSCLPAHPTAFYYGYLDYAYNCFAGTWEPALVLYHGCDKFQHDPLYSSRPGVFHPTRSYALIAPSTMSNPFVPATLTASGGPAFFEGIRDVADPLIIACETEEPLASGAVVKLGSACACPFSFFPPQVTARHMDGKGTCGSNFKSLNLFPALPWFEVMSTSIGTWSNGSSYPGPEAAWVDEGLFLHTEACTVTGAPELFAELKVGATTEGGYFAAVGPVAADKFTDMVNNYSVKVGSPIVPPFFGHVMPSRHLFYVNTF